MKHVTKPRRARPGPSLSTSLGFRLELPAAVLLHGKSLTWDNKACLESCPSRAEGTFSVKNDARSTKVAVSSDGKGLELRAGAVLLWETMRVTGLGRGLAQAMER